jgi:inorganic pyrophosphatase
MIAGKFFGEDFWKAVAETIGAQYYAVRAMAEAGFDVAVDGMLLDLPEYVQLFGMHNLEMVRSLFGPFDPLFVRFDCPLEELRRRNLQRGDRGEFQSEQQAALMTKDPPADLVIDTMTVFPDEAAAMILDASGLPFRAGTKEEDRAALLGEILAPLSVRVLPGIGREDLSRSPGRIETEAVAPDPETAERAAGELSARGYTRTETRQTDAVLLARRRGDTVTELCRITVSPDPDKLLPFDRLSPRIGQLVRVRVDRPAGSAHPEHPGLIYPISYGCLPGTLAADGEEIDAYLAGFRRSPGAGEEVVGTVAAVVHRADDREEKLIVTPPNVFLSGEELSKAVRFTEQYFLSSLLLPERGTEKSCGSIVFRRTENGPEILLLRQGPASGAWTFPKGHMKEGEFPLDTALREAGEEVGLEELHPVRCSDKFPDSSPFASESSPGLWMRCESYPLASGRKKDVLYFLSEAPAGWEPVFRDGEIDKAAWVKKDDDLSPYRLNAQRAAILREAAEKAEEE